MAMLERRATDDGEASARATEPVAPAAATAEPQLPAPEAARAAGPPAGAVRVPEGVAATVGKSTKPRPSAAAAKGKKGQ
jgi:hypothetical protein